jgi:DNA ligase-1
MMNKLFKIDENGNVRVWSMEINLLDPSQYRAVSGVLNGKMVESGWKTAKPKNVGKVNATTAEMQAVLEVDRKYLDQLETGGYYETIDEAREKVQAYFECMLAHKYVDHKDKVSFPVFEQPKLDGIRCLAGRFDLKTRNGKPLLSTPHIHKQLSFLFDSYPKITFDGELYNHELKSDFEKIVSLVRKTKPTDKDKAESAKLVDYWIYDVYDPDRPDMTTMERANFLDHLIGDGFQNIVNVGLHPVYSQEELDEVYGNHIESGYEGQMVRIDAPYEQKRSRNLLKRKEFEDKEFTVEYVEEGVGNWAGAVKRVYIRLEDGSIQKAGVRGSYETLALYLKEKDSFPGTEVTVRFQGRTSDGKLRFPVVTFFWRGKREL